VLQAGRAVVAEEAPGLLMQYVHVPCHLTMRPLVVEQALAVVGTARGCAAAGAAAGVGTGLGCAGRLASLDGPPPGPPGRRSLPLVMGFAAICFPLGVAFDTELGGSPGPTWIVLLLYRSSRGTVESLMTFT
jgi:hypothetical protein